MLDHVRLTVGDVGAAYRLYDPVYDYEPHCYATSFRDPNGFKLEVVTRIQPEGAAP